MTTKTKRQYTEEFKREAVKLVTEQGYKVSEAARNLGVHVSLLRRWKERLEAEQKGEGLKPDEREELRRLRAENRRLRMQREILKKAREPSAVARDSNMLRIVSPTGLLSARRE